MENINKLAVTIRRPWPIRSFAYFFSYLFHPLFIPLYVTLFLMYVHPSYFTGIDAKTHFWLPFIVADITIFFPVFSIFLLKALGFIKSFFLHTQKDRIIPYIISQVFFFWIYWVCRNYSPALPIILTSFMLGVLLSASTALLLNIYMKISMHTIGMGGLVGLFLLIMQSNTMLMTWPLCLALLISGIICTSRLLISDHTQKEIYLGFFIGVLCQFAAALVTM